MRIARLLLAISAAVPAMGSSLGICLDSRTTLHLLTVASMRREAAQILEALNVRVRFQDCSEGSLQVRIVNQPLGNRDILARTRIADGRILPQTDISVRSVGEMLAPDANPTAVGRALGRVLAHEIGHYALQSTGHAKSGLLSAHFTQDYLLSPTVAALP